MKKGIRKYNLFNLALKLVLAAVLFTGPAAKAQVLMLTVISNPNGSPSALKFSELKSIFMGEQQRWRSGTKITIALMKTNTPAGKNTSQKVYNLSGDELNKFWLALVFQGKAQAPNFFNSSTDLQNFVAQNPGAIGILDQADSNSGVMTVIIEGRTSL